MHLERPVRLVCHEGQFEALLGDLALHKLDVALTDRAVRSRTTLRLFSHQRFESATIVAGAPALAGIYRAGFPASVNGAPFLVPTRNNALRGRIDEWCEQNALRPAIAGEFEDNTLLNTFGRRRLGRFFARARESALFEPPGLAGPVPQLRDQFYAISNQPKIKHPVEAILAALHQAG